jgi:hypothetical protein
MFLSFLRNIATIILLGDMFQRRYPETFDQLLVTFSVNAIYLASNIEILFNKTTRKLNNNPFLFGLKTNINGLIKKIRQSQRQKHIPELVYVTDGSIHNHITVNADFMMYSFIPDEDDNNCSNCIKKIIIPVESSEINKMVHNYELSDVKFMMVELKIQENNEQNNQEAISSTHKIEFKTDNHDFYIVNNRFSKAFFKYYLRNVLKYTKEFKDNERWSLKIIDHNVDMVIIDFTEKNEDLVLEKNSYKINI